MRDWLPFFTILLLFSCLLAYEYIRDLRRALKAKENEASTAWRLYDNAVRELAHLQGKPVPQSSFPDDPHTYQPPENEKPADGFRPMGIGPTAIMDRERRRTQQEAVEREPRFAHKGVLTNRPPTADEIAAAAREATDGGHLN